MSQQTLARLSAALTVLALALTALLGPARPAQALAPAWQPNTAYAVNQLVSYNNVEYKCIQAHTSLVGWEPPNVPALWGRQSTVSTATPTRAATATPTRAATATPTRAATATPTRVTTATPTRVATATPTRVATATPTTGGGLKKHILVGYWHNFDNGSGNIKLRNVSTKWDVINVSFAEPTSPTSGDMRFTPYNDTVAGFQADVAYLKSQGKRVLISIGGANGQVQLTTTAARDAFVNTMAGIISTYGFDGIDIDFEGHSLILNPGDRDINNPTTPVIVNTIAALRSLKARFGAGLMLTMAPETFFVQLGYSFYGGTCSGCDTRAGAYLPVIQALRNDLNWLQVQNYNSGPIAGLDGQYHSMGSADFHVAMLDMLLAGFSVAGTGQTFAALRPDQVVLGLPANGNAGGGYTAPAEVQRAVDHIVRGIPATSYQLRSNPANNGAFRGMMAWSVNWDQFAGFIFTNSHRPYLDALP
ncbi:MAG TPA: glycosyl hydrolase family 18 protein [Roseiflexaceae bacterium]|nr:glycosyl hydrolase family 18 protein [Roseiflexaceae bacterium]